MKKKFFLWLFLFFFLTTFYFDFSKTNISEFFTIKNFEIKNTENTDIDLAYSKLEKFKNNNIFLINNDEIASSITDIDFVKDVGIKKVYPDKIEINIKEHTIVALISNNENRYMLSKEGHIIKNYNNKFNSLPLIYGKNTENYFPYFYKLLNDINFDLSKIKYLKYFESNRWDIFLKDGKLIKLSSDKSVAKESLANFIAIYSDKKFEQYKIFDFRVKNQLILK